MSKLFGKCLNCGKDILLEIGCEPCLRELRQELQKDSSETEGDYEGY